MLYRFRRHDKTTATAGTVLGVAWFAVRSWLRIPHTASHHAALQIPHRFLGRDVVSKRLIADAHRAGMVVHVWTVNDEADMRELVDRGVDGIMTDRPSTLAKVLLR
jgi:glycerophosphoryl diester phosphodiesterase